MEETLFCARGGIDIHTSELFSLVGKKAIVTGGGRGLCQQIALILAEMDADIFICTSRTGNCENIAKILREKTGRNVYTSRLDVTDCENVRQTITLAASKLGRIDILVNNSGIAWGAPVLEMPFDKWNQVMAVNASGTFLVSQAVGRVSDTRVSFYYGCDG